MVCSALSIHAQLTSLYIIYTSYAAVYKISYKTIIMHVAMHGDLSYLELACSTYTAHQHNKLPSSPMPACVYAATVGELCALYNYMYSTLSRIVQMRLHCLDAFLIQMGACAMHADCRWLSMCACVYVCMYV